MKWKLPFKVPYYGVFKNFKKEDSKPSGKEASKPPADSWLREISTSSIQLNDREKPHRQSTAGVINSRNNPKNSSPTTRASKRTSSMQESFSSVRSTFRRRASLPLDPDFQSIKEISDTRAIAVGSKVWTPSFGIGKVRAVSTSCVTLSIKSNNTAYVPISNIRRIKYSAGNAVNTPFGTARVLCAHKTPGVYIASLDQRSRTLRLYVSSSSISKVQSPDYRIQYDNVDTEDDKMSLSNFYNLRLSSVQILTDRAKRWTSSIIKKVPPPVTIASKGDVLQTIFGTGIFIQKLNSKNNNSSSSSVITTEDDFDHVVKVVLINSGLRAWVTGAGTYKKSVSENVWTHRGKGTIISGSEKALDVMFVNDETLESQTVSIPISFCQVKSSKYYNVVPERKTRHRKRESITSEFKKRILKSFSQSDRKIVRLPSVEVLEEFVSHASNSLSPEEVSVLLGLATTRHHELVAIYEQAQLPVVPINNYALVQVAPIVTLLKNLASR